MKLSERLEAAVERLYEDGMDTRGIADLFRESAELARRVEGAQDGIEDVLRQLDSFCRAYPTDVFPEPTPKEIKQLNGQHPGAVTRISASMGRRMTKHMRRMVDAVRQLVPEDGQGSVMTEECPRCDGSGEIHDAYWTCGNPECCGSGAGECPDCGGTGKSPTPPDPTPQEVPDA